MIEHQKRVLRGVCHNQELFKKELLKSLNWLPPYEQFQLKEWVKENCYQHTEIINDIVDAHRIKPNEGFN